MRCGPLDVVADHEARREGNSDIPQSLLRLAQSVRTPAQVVDADADPEALARAAVAISALGADSHADTFIAAYERLEWAAEQRWLRCLLVHDWIGGLEAIDALVKAKLTLGQLPDRLLTLADAHAILMKAVPFERATPPRIVTSEAFDAALVERFGRPGQFAPVSRALYRRPDVELSRNAGPEAWTSHSFLQHLSGTLITTQVRSAFEARETPRPADAYTGLLALLSAIGRNTAREEQQHSQLRPGEDLLIIGHSLTAYVEAAGHFNDLDTVIEASEYLTSIGQRLVDLAPSQPGDDPALYRSHGATYAATGLSKHLKALVETADQPSLERALDLAKDAYEWLSKAPKADVDRANVAQQEALAALQLGDVARTRRALSRGRTAAEHVANQNQLKVFDWMSSVVRALDGTPETLRSLPELEFVVMAEKHPRGLRDVCATLERELADDPTGPRTIELLILAARLLGREGISQECRDACDELRAAAGALLDANRVLLTDTGDLRLGTDDSHMARRLSASIVRDGLDRGDVRSALAAADGARGRILLADLTVPRGSSTSLRDGIDGNRNPGVSRATDRMLRERAIRGLQPLPPWDGPIGTLRAMGWLRRLGKDLRAWANALTEPLGGGALTKEEITITVQEHGEPVLLLHPIEEALALFLALPDRNVYVKTSPASTSEILGHLTALQSDIGAWVSARQQGEQEWADGSDATQSPYRQAARELHRSLVAPFRDQLAGHTRLTIVPYRELSSVPFGLLEDESGTLLVERFTLAVAPSIASLRILERPAADSNVPRACIFGAPLTSGNLEPLAGAAKEAERLRERLATVHPAAAIGFRINEDATPANYAIDARGSQLLHLACHAGVGNVSGAALYLAPDADGRHTLDASNIAHVPLAHAVVFLAACRSGSGRATADGSIGAAREFLRAGARAVIASHWKVSDDVTTKIVAEFYERFLERDEKTEGPDVASALQGAMLATRDELSRAEAGIGGQVHAGWWAPFFVLGCGTVADPLALPRQA
jgi:CHAT domain-containing protein